MPVKDNPYSFPDTVSFSSAYEAKLPASVTAADLMV